MDVAQQIKAILADFGEEIENKIEANIIEASKESVKELKQTSPKRTGKEALRTDFSKNQKNRKPGTYAKSWRYKREKGFFNTKSTIYAGNGEHRLTHLLEKGHALWQGGRTKPKPHIKPVEVKYSKILEEKMEEL